jgi:hypothetical protein
MTRVLKVVERVVSVDDAIVEHSYEADTHDSVAETVLSSSTSSVTFIEMRQRNDLLHLIKNGFVAAFRSSIGC